MLLLAFASSAEAATFVSSTPIAGDPVAVTLTIDDAPEGDAVDVTLSIPDGSGDLLGLFGNIVPETLVAAMTIVDDSGVVTQSQLAADRVWKVGGGNVMSPIKRWDWGLRFGSAGSSGGAITQASFRLAAPGLTAASLTEAFNQGWRFGVRIQSTVGPEGSAKIGVAATQPPQGIPPAVVIASPADGALLATSAVDVMGSVSGSSPVAVTVNGAPATSDGAGFAALLSLPDGPHTLTATATNGFGSASDAVAVTIDTIPPLVTITAPTPGTLTAATSLTVTGTVADASLLVGVTVNGVPATVSGEIFSADLPLALGENTIRAEATDAAGHTGSDTTSVIRGLPPTIAIAMPSDGALLAESPVRVTGPVSGTDPIAVTVGGGAATVDAGSFTALLPLPDGSHSLTATATSPFGMASTAVSFVIDTTPPSVTITSPADGAIVNEQPISVTGTVVDESPIVSLRIDGDPIAVASSFATTAALAEGPNTILVEATDAAGNEGAAHVSVTFEPVPALSLTIETPPEGAIFSRSEIDVAGSVSDPAASVRLGGVQAVVTGLRWVANAVPLEEGPNTLTAIATRGVATASDVRTVIHNAPPRVVITSPTDRASLRDSAVDVDGVVDDPSAFVDVNGIHASVGSGGRFTARSVPLEPGENPLVARAVDGLGASATDQVTVLRADESAGRLRLVFVVPERLRRGADPHDPDAVAPLIAEDGDEFAAALSAIGFPASLFVPPIEAPAVGFNTFFAYLFVFAEAGRIGEPVEIPGFRDQFPAFSDSQPLRPISELAEEISSLADASEIEAELIPSDFPPNGFALFPLRFGGAPQ